MFATCLIGKINEPRNVNVLTMRILQNFVKLIPIREEFTHWQTEVDNYKTALQVYRDTNNVKINLSWEPGSNYRTGLSLV